MSPFAPLEWTGAILAGMEAAGLFVMPLLGRSFARMYADLGGEVPLLSRLATSVWFPLLLAGLVAAAIAFALRATTAPRRALLLAAFLVGAAGIAACVIGFYLPIFTLAGRIKE